MPFFGITAIFSFFLLFLTSTAQNDVNRTAKNQLIIGVPILGSYSQKFVQKDQGNKYTGFSIQVFEEAQKLLDYKIYYKFVEFNGTYDDLVSSVGNKTLDAAVADITVIAKRWDLVDFTVPYTESGLAMVVPFISAAEPWIFLKPFTLGLWLATGGILLYTMIVVWFLEHRSNPDFGGLWHHQIGNASWFTFTSLFTAHRETVKSNHSRVVVIVWLFLALIIMQSFTASLTSLLTVKRLKPNVDSLINEYAKVGCNTFVKSFVQIELGLRSENIELIGSQEGYSKALKTGTISAALLEIPYAKLLVNGHCKEYATTGSSYKFGGLSFAFQKGSQLAKDVSKAILKLSESGKLTELEKLWITSSSECLDSTADKNTDSLTFESFWGLYLFSASIATASVLVFIARMLVNYPHYRRIEMANIAEEKNMNTWHEIVKILKYLKNAELRNSGNAPICGVTPEIQMVPQHEIYIPEHEIYIRSCRF